MGFWSDWKEFLSENAKRHMKRMSIAIGAFLVLIITSIPLGLDAFIVVVYAGIVETSSIILMSLFGKNGNNNDKENEEDQE